jgi:hypothetical protein
MQFVLKNIKKNIAMSKQTFIEKTLGDESDQMVLRRLDSKVPFFGESGYTKSIENDLVGITDSLRFDGKLFFRHPENHYFHFVTGEKSTRDNLCFYSLDLQDLIDFNSPVILWNNHDFAQRKGKLSMLLSGMYCIQSVSIIETKLDAIDSYFIDGEENFFSLYSSTLISPAEPEFFSDHTLADSFRYCDDLDQLVQRFSYSILVNTKAKA